MLCCADGAQVSGERGRACKICRKNGWGAMAARTLTRTLTWQAPITPAPVAQTKPGPAAIPVRYPSYVQLNMFCM